MKTFIYLILSMFVFFTISCKSEDRDIPPTIFQESMEVSEEKPETYFKVGPYDYDMWGFRLVKKNKNGEYENNEYVPISKEMKGKAASVVNVSDDEEAIVFCENGKLKKIVFNAITIEKTGKGKYEVKLNSNKKSQESQIYDFSFICSHGGNSATIYINKEQIK
ncbi:MAG: hypothetical protein J6M59_03895 [Bacteroidaceae bacterium]|nr:hypothetical protein [Bacteroidaceae bacterium]